MPIKLLSPMLCQALKLAKANCPVLPLFEPVGRNCSCGDSNCSRIGKHPRVPNGVHDATTNPDLLRDWWSRWPEANIGLATGSASGLTVIDIDGPRGYDTLAALTGRAFSAPSASIIRTGRGVHVFYRTGTMPIPNMRLGDAVDLRGDRGYVVAVGSRHASGRYYRHSSWGVKHPTRLKPDIPPPWLRAILDNRLPSSIVTATPKVSSDAYFEAALNGELDRLRQAPEGERNNTLNRCAFRLAQLINGGAIDWNTVRMQLMIAAHGIGLGESEASSTIESGFKAGQMEPRPIVLTSGLYNSPVVSDPIVEELAKLGETDADNARRLARRYENQLACTPGSGYLIYDGKRWVRDKQSTRVGFAEETARAIALEAAFLTDPREKASRAACATRSLSKGALDRMIDVAQYRLMKRDELFDTDDFVLNVENGTLDLREGSLRRHSSSDWLTKLAPVRYDPAATCPTFEGFLDRALKGDAELISYVQKAIGYTLTGLTGEQIFFFPFGPGSTGKSTLVNVIRELMGDYGIHASTDTFTAKQHDNGIPADLARLKGARMVTAVEVNWSRQIDEARVKALTGGDPITARHLYRDFFEFQPACKLWFVANDLPGVRGTAEAFWRRVHLIPFDVIIPKEERDDRLVERLKAEAEGILAWAVRGCLAWQKDGLSPPEAVRRGIEGWQRKADHVARFFNDELILDQENTTPAAEVYHRYEGWCRKNGEKPLDTRKLKAALGGQALTHKRTNTGSVWSGVKLRLNG